MCGQQTFFNSSMTLKSKQHPGKYTPTKMGGGDGGGFLFKKDLIAENILVTEQFRRAEIHLFPRCFPTQP